MYPLTTWGVSGGGIYGQVKGSPVTKGCFEACKHIGSYLTIHIQEIILQTIRWG